MPRTNYIWDEVNDTLLAETDEAGNTIAEYTHEPGQFGPLISQRRNGHTYYHHYDGQGSTRALTDESGNVTDRYTYTGFGEPVASSGATANPFGYKGALGYYANPETSDLYVRARAYQPLIARWSSDASFADRRGNRNTQGYATGNPLMIVASDSTARTSGLKTASVSQLKAIGNRFLAAFPLLSPVACGSVCAGQFYGGVLPGGDPHGRFGFREGMFFGALWVDTGNCADPGVPASGSKIHVRLIYTTLTIGESGIECNRTAESEFNDGSVDPTEAYFDTPGTGCTFLDPAHPGHLTHRTGLPPDCSYVTYGWDCPIQCIPAFEMGERNGSPATLIPIKTCVSRRVQTQIISAPPESYWVRHDVAFLGSCCRTWPCSAKLDFKEQIGPAQTNYGCWDFRDPGFLMPK